MLLFTVIPCDSTGFGRQRISSIANSNSKWKKRRPQCLWGCAFFCSLRYHAFYKKTHVVTLFRWPLFLLTLTLRSGNVWYISDSLKGWMEWVRNKIHVFWIKRHRLMNEEGELCLIRRIMKIFCLGFAFDSQKLNKNNVRCRCRLEKCSRRHKTQFACQNRIRNRCWCHGDCNWLKDFNDNKRSKSIQF